MISQCKNERACRVCRRSGHEEGSEQCPAYSVNDSVVFKGEADVLSNFHMCKIMWKGEECRSSEHIYQAEKALQNKRPDIAAEIQLAKSALEAKNLGRKVYTSSTWEEQNESLMFEILTEKAKQRIESKEKLLKSADKIIAEAVPNQLHWSCGLSKDAACCTDPEYWPGKNILGRMWIAVRNDLSKDHEKGKDAGSTKRKDRESEGESTPLSRNRPNGTTPDKVNSKIPSPVQNPTIKSGKSNSSFKKNPENKGKRK